MVSRFPNQNRAIAFSELCDFDFEDGHSVDTPQAMKHRTVDYGVEEVEPGRWRWIIRPPGRTIQGPPKFRTREQAVAACMEEINNGIERTRRRLR
jgi:hypothetical protein